MKEGRGAFKILIGKLIGRRPLGSPNRIGEDNVTMEL